MTTINNAMLLNDLNTNKATTTTTNTINVIPGTVTKPILIKPIVTKPLASAMQVPTAPVPTTTSVPAPVPTTTPEVVPEVVPETKSPSVSTDVPLITDAPLVTPSSTIPPPTVPSPVVPSNIMTNETKKNLTFYDSVLEKINRISKIEDKCGLGKYIFSVFHVIMTFIAIYLVHKCNGEFNFGGFIVALFFPYIYIVYTLATKGLCNNIVHTVKAVAAPVSTLVKPVVTLAKPVVAPVIKLD